MTHPTYEHFWKFNNVNNILDIFFGKNFGKWTRYSVGALEQDAFDGVKELFDTLGERGLEEEEIYTVIIRQLEKRWSNTIWEGDESDEVDIDGSGIQSFGLRRSILKND